jgi:hypothetical protein
LIGLAALSRKLSLLEMDIKIKIIDPRACPICVKIESLERDEILAYFFTFAPDRNLHVETKSRNTV